MNTEPLMPIEFEEVLKKTQASILEWKRNEGNRFWEE
jgi:hypothetical protein